MKRTIVTVLVSMLLAGSQVWAQRGAVDAAAVAAAFRQYVESLPYLADSSIERMRLQVEEHMRCLQNWKDKRGYMEEHGLEQWLASQRDSVGYYRGLAPGLADGFMQQFQQQGIADEAACRDSLLAIVGGRLGCVEANLNHLERVISVEGLAASAQPIGWKWLALLVAALAVLAALGIALWRRREKGAPLPSTQRGEARPVQGAQGKDAGIVVRRKTTTILKKQSLEDVIGNPAYLQVDAADFTYESAVRRIYIKNTCIEDIYNMYARDLQSPDGTKEDGCMVLGRWVFDQESHEYYVSLEQTVMPGDDAVFDEYELNFGGKIKLRVVEQLRRLRRETNFQYDLTCWVHSHPGLGVFFSNSDVGVQMQLKHPAHPGFLTAIVVDILTPDMQLGIFTFRRDQTINSQSDLKLLYSLREWYEWASREPLARLPQGEKPGTDDDYVTLAAPAVRTDGCWAICLSREMIVDLCMAASEDSSGVLGLIHGDCSQSGSKTVCCAQRLSNNEQVGDMQLLGCLVADSHGSIPSIRKAVAGRMEKLRFVLVYSPASGSVTSMPVVDGELCADDSFYGQQSLDELKKKLKNLVGT